MPWRARCCCAPTCYHSRWISVTRKRSFPSVYIVNILPLTIARSAAVAGHRVPDAFVAAAGAIFALNGFCNVLLYSLTRRFLHLSFASRPRRPLSLSLSPASTAPRTSSCTRKRPPSSSEGFASLDDRAETAVRWSERVRASKPLPGVPLVDRPGSGDSDFAVHLSHSDSQGSVELEEAESADEKAESTQVGERAG